VAEQFRRTDPRYLRRVEVEIEAAGARHIVMTRNLSLGGMFVEITPPLAVATHVQVRFRLPNQREIIDVAGEVRWIEGHAKADGGGVGIRLEGLRARDVWALNRFFQS
jgi:Tfp pilus assembly protein PilZ